MIEVVRHPTRVIIIGASGSGKSATAYYLAEELGKALHIPVYVYGIDPERQFVYPPQIRHVGPGDPLPENAILIIDEAAMAGPARRSMRSENVELANLAYKARHKNLTTIAVTQAGSELDKILVESAEIIVVKKPRPYQAETDRIHLRPLLKEAERAFKDLDPSEDPRGFAYIDHQGVREMFPTGLASFWTEGISHIMSDSVLDSVHPRRYSKEKKRQIARDLRARGWSYSRIARELGIAKSTAYYWVKGYPKKMSTTDTDKRVEHLGEESFTLCFPEQAQQFLLQVRMLSREEWAFFLYCEQGRIFIGDLTTVSEILSAKPTKQLVGFASSRKLSKEELRRWLEQCSVGVPWPGPKVEVFVRPNTLDVRTWPSGSHWYDQVLLETEGKPDRLEIVAKERPMSEILTPKNLLIGSDGTVEECEEDHHPLRPSDHILEGWETTLRGLRACEINEYINALIR